MLLRLTPIALAGALLVACEVDPTELVVVIRTDMAVASSLDGFRVRVLDGHDRLAEDERTFTLEGADAVELPATFGVAPEGRDPDRRVAVEVDARLDGRTLFTTRARTGFVEHQILRLDMWLADRCVAEAETCDAGETCGRAGCVSSEVPPSLLSPWHPLDASPGESDGGPDAGDAGDAGIESPLFGARVARGNELHATDLVVDDAHAVYVTGSFLGEADFDDDDDNDPTPSAGSQDMFVARVDESGERRWLATFGEVGGLVTPGQLAWSSTGALLVAATAYHSPGPSTVCGVTSSTGLSLPVILEIDPDTGECLGAEFFEAVRIESTGQGRSIAVAADGTVTVAGSFHSGLTVGADVLDSLRIEDEVFAVSLDGAGCVVDPAGTAVSQTWSLAVAEGGLLLGGNLRTGSGGGTLDFSGQIAESSGVADAFLLHTDANCQPSWLRTLVGDIKSIGVVPRDDDGAGEALLVATSRGDVSFGIATSVTGLGALDIVAARLGPLGDPEPGEVLLLGADSDEQALDVAPLDDDGILVGGNFFDHTDLVGRIVPSRGVSDGLVFVLDEDLGVRWLQEVGSGGEDTVTAVAYDPLRDVIVAAGDSTQGLILGDVAFDSAPYERLVFVHRFQQPPGR